MRYRAVVDGATRPAIRRPRVDGYGEKRDVVELVLFVVLHETKAT